MNEKEFGGKVSRLLQASLNEIDDATVAKLKSARLEALARYDYRKAPMPRLAWAGASGSRFGNLFSQRPLIFVAPLVAALLALGIAGYWQYLRQNDGDDIDAFLLAGDLPNITASGIRTRDGSRRRSNTRLHRRSLGYGKTRRGRRTQRQSVERWKGAAWSGTCIRRSATGSS